MSQEPLYEGKQLEALIAGFCPFCESEIRGTSFSDDGICPNCGAQVIEVDHYDPSEQ